MIADLEKQFGFDKPVHVRFFTMVWNYLQFDFGASYFQDRPVVELVLERMPVSLSLGGWSLLIIYGISIPLGVAKAVRDGTAFDFWTSTMIFVGYAIPGFILAILLIVIFAGGNYFDIFPLRGLVSENWHELGFFGKLGDYLWHMVMPLAALTVGGFATLDDADQELVSRRDQQAVRAHRAGEGARRAARAVRARLPQRHADRHRGLS